MIRALLLGALLAPAAAWGCPDPPTPGDFACAAEKVCARPPSGSVDVWTFLCAARDGDLDAIVARLPARFRKNFTLKHGARRPGERGHAQDAVDDSPSAHPAAMRIFAWDETTGFSISYDGTTPAPGASARAQRTAHRLGMLSVEPATGAFALWALELPVQGVPFQPTHPEDDCHACHGPDSRPIWPMYPDWPGFVGSDNDELTRGTPAQHEEQRWLREGRATPRLAILFAPAIDAYLADLFAHLDRAAIRAYLATRPRPSRGLRAAAKGDDATLRRWLGLELHPGFPYRADHELQVAEASRALFHRPNSRAGMLYNRLQARRLMTRIRETALYRTQPALVALTLMDCGWPDGPARAEAYRRFAETARAELTAAAMPPPAGDRILYPVLLAALRLRVRDVDLRLAYRSHEYDRFDRAYAAPTPARTVMDLGYLPYPGDGSPVNGATRFWSSYFDGSASLDELLALAILDELAAKDPALAALYRPMSLGEKYSGATARYAIDRPFFDEMDRLGRWFPLPYPEPLAAVHHRDPFDRKREPSFAIQYRAVCEYLRR